MKNSHLSARSKIQITQQNGLDPLQINELIVEKKIFMPLIISGQHQPNTYPMIFKIMRQKNMGKIIMYILSQADLYFLYKVQLTTQDIDNLNNHYKLSLKKMPDFVQLMKSCLDQIQQGQKQGTLEITSEDEIQFVLKKLVGGKSHIVMILQGRQQSQQMIKVHVAYRYGTIRQRIQKKQEKIDQLRELIKVKNPYLIKNFKQI